MKNTTFASSLLPLGGRRKVWIALGSLLFVLLVAGTLFAAFRPKYAVLFADLQDRDLAALVGQLEAKKVTFEIGNDGKSILVPEDEVLRTRLQLMGQDVALQGTVGFELFNNTDLGMTEFVQKVNYQRALQGELARTIQSMDEVRSARVQLAIPEQGAFRKAQTKTKASVYLQLKPERVLSRAQVTGIQRLVAASVPDIAAADVAVLDQRGVVLGSTGAGEDALDDTWSDRQKRVEADLTKKAGAVLDRMFGAGASLVSVNVQLDTQRRATTLEEAVSSHAEADQAPTGVVVHERQITRTLPNASQMPNAMTTTDGAVSESTSETDYSVGKRTEQIQTPAGEIRQISVAVVLKAAVAEADVASLRTLLFAAVGGNAQRGDNIVVTTARELAAANASDARDTTVPAPTLQPAGPRTAAPRTDRPQSNTALPYPGWIALAVALGLAALVTLSLRRRRVSTLSGKDREAMLVAVRTWIGDAPASSERSRR